jgi:hypothetical protein
MHKQIVSNLDKLKLLTYQNVTKEERKHFETMGYGNLPDDIIVGGLWEEYKRVKDAPDKNELPILIASEVAADVRNIKYCVWFFVVLSVLSLAVSIVAALA